MRVIPRHKLADFRMNVRRERRQIEWRMSLGLWIALATGIIAFRNAQIRVPQYLLALFLVLVIAGHAWLWVGGNWWRNERDAKRAYEMIAKAEDLFGIEPYQAPQGPWMKLVKRIERIVGLQEGALRIFTHSPPFFEMLATVLLAIAWLILNGLGK
jgi:hypothetical protein